MNLYYLIHESPIGELLLIANETALTELHIRHGRHVPAVSTKRQHSPDHPILKQAQHELDAYFSGRLKKFMVPLAAQGTAFQKLAWAALESIPYGETRSYAQQAIAIGNAAATRAVGAANGRNPIGIIVPCHRVIGASGNMTGYAGGLEAKRFLLNLEAANSAVQAPVLRKAARKPIMRDISSTSSASLPQDQLFAHSAA